MKHTNQKMEFQAIIGQTTPPAQDGVPVSTPGTPGTGEPGQQPQGPSPMAGLFLPVLMIVVMYFILIRPQQKKMKEHQKLLSKLSGGDKVVTTGGLIGTIITIKEDKVSLRTGDSKVEVRKSNISDVLERSTASATPAESNS